MPTTATFTHIAPPANPPKKRFGIIDVLLIAGMVVAIPVTLVLLGGAALTANSCGAFADGCDTSGQPGPGFGWFLVGGAASALVVPTCIVSLIGRAVWRLNRNRLADAS
jgi:hypothetical protein